MKRYSKYLTLIIFIILIGIINKNIEAREWVIPGFEGQVMDATTGAPVENALVQAIWHSEGISFSLISESGEGISSTKEIVTDKEGKFKLKSKINMPIIDDFNGVSIEITHPLYVNKYELVYGSGVTTKNKEQTNGTIRYDIKLVGVEEAIRRGAEEYRKTGESAKFQFRSFIGTYSGSFFKDHWDKKFVEDVLKKWEEIGGKYEILGKGRIGSLLYEINRLKKEVEEAYNGDK